MLLTTAVISQDSLDTEYNDESYIDQNRTSDLFQPDRRVGFVIFGFIGTILLSLLRMRFLWWNLHPVGYAISGSWAINPMIGSIFIGWLLKWIVLKYGGIRWHRSAIPLFLGIVLGEFLGGTFWSLLGIVLRQPMYRFQF